MSALKRISTLFTITALLSLALVGLGAFVRVTGAGLSCPDWPLCFGEIVPPFREHGVAQEYAHRVLAGAVTLLILTLVFLSARIKSISSVPFRFSVWLLVLVVIQAVFGGLTVLMRLNPLIVTSHLFLGTVFLQLTALAAVSTRAQAHAAPHARSSGWRGPVLVLIFLTFIQILLGGFTAASGASLACPSFPLCPAFFAETIQQRIGAHLIYTHGILGILIFLISIWLLVAASRARLTNRPHYRGMKSLACLLFLQILVGFANIHMRIPVAVAVLHLILAQSILYTLLLHVRRRKD